MREIRSKLSNLVPGDIIHARCPNGPSLICLVEAIGPDRIETRRVTTQDHVSFDMDTGEDIDDSPIRCIIDSIAPVPVDVHNVLLGLDRKMRLGQPPLNQAEKDALVFVGRFYRAHPL